MKIWIAIALSLLGAVFLFGQSSGQHCVASADVGQPSQYCGYVDLSATNNTGGALTDHKVRYDFAYASFLSSQRIDPQGWGWYCTEGSFSNQRWLYAQDLTEATAGLWVEYPSIANGATATMRCYLGRAGTQRDQGVTFTGSEYATVTDAPEIEPTDNFQLDLEIELTDLTPRADVIIDKLSAGAGYQVELYDNASTLAFRFTVDTGTCAVDVDPSWLNSKDSYSFRYTAAAGNDCFVYRNGVLQASTDIDQGPINGNVQNLFVGNTSAAGDAAGFILYDIKISNSSTGATGAHWLFGAETQDGFTGSAPYLHTVPDTVPAANDMSLYFNHSQTNISVAQGAYTLTGVGTQVAVPSTRADVIGTFLPNSAFNASGNAAARTWPLTLFNLPAGSTFPPGAYWMLLTATLATVFGLMAYGVTREVVPALMVAGAVITWFVIDGVLPTWWLVFWLSLVPTGVLASRWPRSG